MKTYFAIVLTLILVTLMGATYLLYKNYQKPTAINNYVPTEGVVQKAKPTNVPVKELEQDVTSKVTGKICYPSEVIPEMDVYLQNTETKDFQKLQISFNQANFEFKGVVPGNYVAFAYLKDNSSSGGGYTNAVSCGLTVTCKDHTLVEFKIVGGIDYANVDVCDWYGAELPAKP